MASVTKDKNGFRIAWRDGDKRRRRIRVSGVSKRQAESIALRVQALAGVKISGDAVDSATAAWVGSLGDDLHGKLAEHGLVERRRNSQLQAFVDRFIKMESADVSERTVLNWQATRDKLMEFLGNDCNLRSIGEEEAVAWHAWLGQQKTKSGTPFAKATISGHVKRAKRFFNAAARARYIDRSPFDAITAGSQVNDDRKAYVSSADVDRVIDRASDAEWRLIVALARYAGLRMPSEALRLEWVDIDWERNRITIRKGKTKKREMPLLPQLRPYLEDCFDPEATHVIVEHRRHSNWATDVKRFIARAGLQVWPRCFHNLRASLETDLVHRFPIHVVSTWLGNSPKIASDHYLSIRDEDFALAVGQGAGQQSRESNGNGPQLASQITPESPGMVLVAEYGGKTEYAWQDSNLRPTD